MAESKKKQQQKPASGAASAPSGDAGARAEWDSRMKKAEARFDRLAQDSTYKWRNVWKVVRGVTDVVHADDMAEWKDEVDKQLDSFNFRAPEIANGAAWHAMQKLVNEHKEWKNLEAMGDVWTGAKKNAHEEPPSSSGTIWAGKSPSSSGTIWAGKDEKQATASLAGKKRKPVASAESTADAVNRKPKPSAKGIKCSKCKQDVRRDNKFHNVSKEKKNTVYGGGLCFTCYLFEQQLCDTCGERGSKDGLVGDADDPERFYYFCPKHAHDLNFFPKKGLAAFVMSHAFVMEGRCGQCGDQFNKGEPVDALPVCNKCRKCHTWKPDAAKESGSAAAPPANKKPKVSPSPRSKLTKDEEKTLAEWKKDARVSKRADEKRAKDCAGSLFDPLTFNPLLIGNSSSLTWPQLPEWIKEYALYNSADVSIACEDGDY